MKLPIIELIDRAILNGVKFSKEGSAITWRYAMWGKDQSVAYSGKGFPSITDAAHDAEAKCGQHWSAE